MHHVDLNINPVGIESIRIDGEDVTPISSGVSIVAEDGVPTKVRIQLRPGSTIPSICTECDVEFIMDADPSEQTRTWLQQIDGDVVMNRAMEHLGLGDSTKSVASLFLDELIRLLG